MRSSVSCSKRVRSRTQRSPSAYVDTAFTKPISLLGLRPLFAASACSQQRRPAPLMRDACASLEVALSQGQCASGDRRAARASASHKGPCDSGGGGTTTRSRRDDTRIWTTPIVQAPAPYRSPPRRSLAPGAPASARVRVRIGLQQSPHGCSSRALASVASMLECWRAWRTEHRGRARLRRNRREPPRQ
jgi:hypothetical protein